MPHNDTTPPCPMLHPQKQEASALVLEAMNALKDGGVLKKWNAAGAEPFSRRNVFLGDLKRVGVLNPSGIGVASIREGVRQLALHAVHGSCHQDLAVTVQGMTRRSCLRWWAPPGTANLFPRATVTCLRPAVC